jgi:hypothetical protein
MPLRDHFRPPVDKKHAWDELHGLWPGVLVLDLFRRLPTRFVAAPTVHLGTVAEIDISTFDTDVGAPFDPGSDTAGGGTATAVWSPPQATVSVATELPGQDEYEVRVYDADRERRLVAVIELVSPSNKDRPGHRSAFVGKCAALVEKGVAVAIVDPVTTKHFNLYAELLEVIGQKDPTLGDAPPSTYASICRFVGRRKAIRFESWSHTLAIGRPLPTLPLWLTEKFAVPLELESTYEETCRTLRIA